MSRVARWTASRPATRSRADAGKVFTADSGRGRGPQLPHRNACSGSCIKGADRAEARMCVKFARREFRVYVNGELLWSRNYGLEDTRQFDADAAAKPS